jgi:opacity protein-like surface antigen
MAHLKKDDSMMRTAFLFVLSALVLPVISTSASAQDAIDPEAGDTSADAAATGDVSADASATPAADSAASSDGAAKPISVALFIGYGLTLDDGIDVGDNVNPYGLGFGARGGYNLDKIYLGVRFVFYLGESNDIANPLGGTIESSINVWELGIEGGYDLALSDTVTLRPEFGLGIAGASADAGGFSSSSTDLFIAPGASLLFDVTDSVFLGVDVRLHVILGDETILALPILATGGMRF